MQKIDKGEISMFCFIRDTSEDSHYINVEYIERLSTVHSYDSMSYYIILKSGNSIKVSRDFYIEIHHVLNDLHEIKDLTIQNI